jgi:hypothetical protein
MKDRLQLAAIAIASFTLSMGIWAMQERPWRMLKLAQAPLERSHLPRAGAPTPAAKPAALPLPPPLPRPPPPPMMRPSIKPPEVKPPDVQPAVLPPMTQGDNQVVQEKPERKFARGQADRTEH